MPSQSPAGKEKHKVLLMNHKVMANQSSVEHQAPRLSKAKAAFLGEHKHLKPGNETEPNVSEDYTSASGQLGIGKSVPRGISHKAWPNAKTSGVDDVVKYMSSVPSYLQRLEKGDNIQEKALNFGVLDWGRLERWTYLQKQVANRTGFYSPSSTNSSTSASCSTFASSSQSTGNTDSPNLRKRSPEYDTHQKSSIEVRETKQIDGQRSDPKIACSESPVKGKMKHSNTKAGSLASTSKVDDVLFSEHNKVNSQVGNSRGLENLKNIEQQNMPGNLYFAENWLQDQCSVVEGMWDHLQGSEHARRLSCDSATVNSGRSEDVNRSSFSGNFPSGDFQFSNQLWNIHYSCPLPSTNQVEIELLPAKSQGKHMKVGQFSENMSGKSAFSTPDKSRHGEVNLTASAHKESSPHRVLNAGLSRIRSSILGEGSSVQNTKSTDVSKISHEDNATSHSSSKHSVTPHSLIGAGLHRIRYSSLREGSSGKEIKENASSGSKNRHSPLRRILDPLLKSKNQITYPYSETSATSQRNQEVCNRDKLPIQVETNSGNESCKSTDANPHQVFEAGSSVQGKKEVSSIRQALLKFAWKNGVPLFIFSANESNILAATLRKGSISQKSDLNCIYTLFTTHELKKKGGIWMGQGNKSKSPDLAYNVVAQMRASSSKSTNNGSKECLVNKFVLHGSQPEQTTQGWSNSPHRNELAAIVIQVPDGWPDNKDALVSNNFRASSCSVGDSHVEQKNETSGQSNVVVILPSGVHGVSSTGEKPSPLIERWRLGGSCDCGGWDEGCMLTVLSDKIQESKSSSSALDCLEDGTRGVELFPQAEDRENKYIFRMSAFKEGLYTVEFGSSIALPQAFAICIAILHSRKPHNLFGKMKSQYIQNRGSTEHMSVISDNKTQYTAPASYVPDCPVSPVSRA